MFSYFYLSTHCNGNNKGSYDLNYFDSSPFIVHCLYKSHPLISLTAHMKNNTAMCLGSGTFKAHLRIVS